MPRRALDLSSGLKLCPKCKETKPLSEFHKSKHTQHGFQVYCKTCGYSRHDNWRRKNLKHMAQDQKRRRQADPERFADYTRKRLYGLAPGEYAQMLAAQQGKCAICKTDKPGGKGKSFHVDHCHTTKNIRALLCSACNMGLGQFRHDQQLLQAAVDYLAKSG